MSTLSGWCMEEKQYRERGSDNLADRKHTHCSYLKCTCENHETEPETED